MRITQGAFSYLPDLTDEEITRQLDYALGQGWALSVEFTDDPHPRNNYWDMWGLPMFDLADPAGALQEIRQCREAYPDRYIRVCAYDSRQGRPAGGGARAPRPPFARPVRKEPADPGDDQRRAVPEPLPDDATVDLATERASAGVDEIIDALDRDLVGLRPVKTRVTEIASLLFIDRVRARFGLSAEPPSLHMCFTGNPGTGKTTVALRMAELLHRMGYLRRGHVVSGTRDDLVGQYIGHTAPKTKHVLNRAIGGLLLLDEAYYLYRAENERDYGQEALEILLQYIENHREDLVVIMAGYADRMETIFTSNHSMSYRIGHHIAHTAY